MSVPGNGLPHRRGPAVLKNPMPRRARTRRLAIEALEPRELLAASITEFPLLAATAQGDIVQGPGGDLYMIDDSNILEVSPTGAVVHTYQLPSTTGAVPVSLAAIPNDPTHSLWVGTIGKVPQGQDAAGQGSGVVRLELNTSNGTITSAPEYVTLGHAVPAITVGPNQQIWFLEYNPPGQGLPQDVSAIGTIDPTAPTLATNIPIEYPTSDVANADGPGSIAIGPNGSVLYTDTANSLVVQVAAQDQGQTVKAGDVLQQIPLNAPTSIVADPDNSEVFWFAAADNQGMIYRYDLGASPSTNPLTAYALPRSTSDAVRLVVGPDKAIWFTDSATGKIGRLDRSAPVTSAVTEYPTTGSLASGNKPFQITTGSNGSLWFTEVGGTQLLANKIGRLDTTSGDLSFVASTDAPGNNVVFGNPFHYLLKITPTAGATFTNVNFTATFPVGIDYFDSPQPSFVHVSHGNSANSAVVRIDSIPAGGLTVSLLVDPADIKTKLGPTGAFNVTIASTPTAATTVATFPSVTVVPASAKLAFVAHAAPTSVHPGDKFNYSFDVTNTGPSDDANLSVTITLPAGLTLLDKSSTAKPELSPGFSQKDNVVTYTQSSVPASSHATVTLSVMVPAGMTATSLDASASYTSALNTKEQSFQFPKVNVLAPVAPPFDVKNLKLALSGPAGQVTSGQSVQYTLTVTNDSDQTATGLYLWTGPLRQQFRTFSVNGVSQNIPNLLPLSNLAKHASEPVTVGVTLDGNYTHYLSLIVVYIDPVTKAAHPVASNQVRTVVSPKVVPSATLSITSVSFVQDAKNTVPRSIVFGRTRTFYFAVLVKNTGSVTATYDQKTDTGGVVFSTTVPTWFNIVTTADFKTGARVDGKDVPVSQEMVNGQVFFRTQLGTMKPGDTRRIVIAVQPGGGLFNSLVQNGPGGVTPAFAVSSGPPKGDTSTAPASVFQTLTTPPLTGFAPGPEAFATTLFQDVLHRAPDQHELYYWSGALATLDEINPNLLNIVTPGLSKSTDGNEQTLGQAFLTAFVPKGVPPAVLDQALADAHNARVKADMKQVNGPGFDAFTQTL